MDTQLKKGFLEYCVLASVMHKDSYGYQIIKDVHDYIEISESTLYPILKRLESQKFVVTYSVEHNGRLRKYYRITESGSQYLRNFLTSWQQIENIYLYVKGEIQNDKK